jgi:two-component system, NtrC family, sensor histidine kinase KinB
MNISIRTKFTIGVVFLFVIILVLSIFPALSINRLSRKTSAILKENHLSVIFARDMQEGLMKINQYIIICFLSKTSTDTALINKELALFEKSLQLEKNNITEAGEDRLVSHIETDFIDFRDSLLTLIKSPYQVNNLMSMQNQFSDISEKLILLSQINGKAIELKTDDAKVSTKNALTQMTILGTVCFLIAFTFIYNFGSYFNERFYQLYNGIKEIVSSNYGQRLYFDGKDEFFEISLVFNEMAEKLKENKEKIALTLPVDKEKDQRFIELKELKNILSRISSIEEEANDLISRLENTA